MLPHLALVDTFTEAEGEATGNEEEAVDRIVEETGLEEDDDRTVDDLMVDVRIVDDLIVDDLIVDDLIVDDRIVDDLTVDDDRLDEDWELVQVPKRELQPVPQYAEVEPQ